MTSIENMPKSHEVSPNTLRKRALAEKNPNKYVLKWRMEHKEEHTRCEDKS